MKFRFRDYFTFTDRERNGAIVLLLLIAGLGLFIYFENRVFSPAHQDLSQFDGFIAGLKKEPQNDSAEDELKPAKSVFPSVAEEAGTHSVFQPKTLFCFNPNGLPENDWVKLGLSPAQARVIKKYEEKGGKFYTKADVRKMFVISAERYAELEPYIVLPETETAENGKSPAAKAKEKKIVELNTADSLQLTDLDGIGPVFAHRILSYRDRLGGFHAVEQLTEVFGMDEEHFTKISPLVKADSTYIHKINVNTASAADLKKHPYIGPGVAQALVNYRKQHGPFQSLPGIMKCDLVNADLYRKIAPYLTL
jgi:competence ComEA-like helix-hairpin-helix protein